MIIKERLIPAGRRNRPATNRASSLYRKEMKPQYITIHNAGSRANAETLNRYVIGTDAAARPASWHFSVDEKDVWQSLPTDEAAWHAGDNLGQGNTNSIGIEICDYALMNSPRNEPLYLQSEEHAAKLCAYLIKTVPSLKPFPVCMKQHHDWSGKNCPSWIRGRGGWNDFLTKVKKYIDAEQPEPEENIWYRVFEGSYRNRANAEQAVGWLKAHGRDGFMLIHKED